VTDCEEESIIEASALQCATGPMVSKISSELS
jgi:hypothetical protein